MHLEFVPVKNQKFDIGRTINPFNCDCAECTFMNCPKNNYAVKMKRKQYKVDSVFKEHKEDILRYNKPSRLLYNFHNRYKLRLTYSVLNDFFDFLSLNFPKGTYWSLEYPETYDSDIEDTVYNRISLVKFNRNGEEIEVGHISVQTSEIYDKYMSKSQYKLACKIKENLDILKELIFEYYEDMNKDCKIGWVDREGRHYKCAGGQHSTLATYLGFTEAEVENKGWVKIFSDSDYYCLQKKSAEQRNWLSLNGYLLDD